MNTPCSEFHPPRQTFRIVYFDCDSTLVSIEGIDELARLKGQAEYIAALTRRAMDGEVKLEHVFAERLRLLQPTRADLKQIARAYRTHLVEDARAVIAALRAIGCRACIVSSGLLPAVQDLARTLGIPARDVYAVPVVFDQLAGEWWHYEYDRYGGNPHERYLTVAATPLTETYGKRTLIAQISQGERRTMLVGDGITDLYAREVVQYFVGFGGVCRRDIVAAQADAYIEASRLSAVVPLALSEADAHRCLGTEHEAVLRRGWEDIQQGRVIFRTR